MSKKQSDSSLQKRIQKDYASLMRRADSLFMMYMNEMGKEIDKANQDCMTIVTATLANYSDTLILTVLIRHRVIDRLREVLYQRYDYLADWIYDYWSEKQDRFDIYSRLISSFISRKAKPPWKPSELNLKDKLSRDGQAGLRMGSLHYTFRLMVDQILREIQRSCVNNETYHQLLTRVRNLFNRDKKQNVREENFNPDKPEYYPDQEQLQLLGMTSITEGAFTLEDVEGFKEDYIKSMGYDHRQYRPYFSDELKANNKWLRTLEQMLASDAVNLLHEGQLQIGSKAMGIKDFEWTAVGHPTLCEECKKRDGLTMSEIKKKLKDETPPPLHPNCFCKLVPKISDEWADREADKSGHEWDSTTGLVYKADKLERSLGATNLSFEQYMNLIGVNP